MKQTLALTALVVRDYDEAIAFFVDVLGFRLVEDTPSPSVGEAAGCSATLAAAVSPKRCEFSWSRTSRRWPRRS